MPRRVTARTDYGPDVTRLVRLAKSIDLDLELLPSVRVEASESLRRVAGVLIERERVRQKGRKR